jgi:2-polyprenyl-3-methyl-5-hydroxy-6-metoxy-1,4-benzoquinol methylase
MAVKGGKSERFIQIRLLRPLRLKAIIKIINHLPFSVKTILDIGCMDDYILERIESRFDYNGIDDEPLCKNSRIQKKKVENLEKGKKYDLVIATEVLEHLDDPVKAMHTIKNLSKRFILISVPNEPFFSLSRFFLPAREHLWTIFPQALERHLGKPILKKKACFNRTYIALWDLKKK